MGSSSLTVLQTFLVHWLDNNTNWYKMLTSYKGLDRTTVTYTEKHSKVLICQEKSV
jgi:hypothetical protein